MVYNCPRSPIYPQSTRTPPCMPSPLSTNMEEEPKAPLPAISLRRFELADVDDMMEWMTDARVSRYMTWDTINTREAALEYLESTIFPHPWYRAVCVDGKPIGSISVRPGAGADRCRAEVSCSLGRKYWARGIAAAAVKMMTLVVFGELPQLERLDALVDVENKGGQRTLEKAGFHREAVHTKFRVLDGKVGDRVRYTFLRVASKL